MENLTLKRCTSCGLSKPINAFYLRNRTVGTKIDSKCKDCERARSLERNYVRNYGITKSEAYSILNKQEGKCAICGEIPARPCVDHCHTSLKVRGVLCHNCNVALGHLRENTESMRRMIEYINQHAPHQPGRPRRDAFSA